MDARNPIEHPQPPVALTASFNSAASHFSVGSSIGFRIFSSESCKVEMEQEFKRHGIAQAQMMGKTNILALVGNKNRGPAFRSHQVVLWDAQKNKPEREITCLSQVKGVRLQPGRVIVILRNWIRIYGTERIPNLLAKYPTADNPYGICCECGPKKVAFPGRTKGQVQLVNFEKDEVSIILAHSTALRALASSVDGELLATASNSGTLIRVWSTTNNSKLVELRRGADNATIFSLGFNPSGTMLASTSDKGTLHIFDVPRSTNQSAPPPTEASRLGDDFDVASTADGDAGAEDVPKKWGILGKIPFMPQYFRDIVSFASDTFDTHEDAQTAGLRRSFAEEMELVAQPKGVIGWPKEDTVVVVGCGCNARFEKWVVAGGAGKRSLIRQGWVNYLEKER